jgi:hypothetical protein
MYHWVDSHFGLEDYQGNYTTSRADREWFTKDYDPFGFGAEPNEAHMCTIGYEADMCNIGCDMGAEHLASFNGEGVFGNAGAFVGAGAGAALVSGGLNVIGFTAALPVLGAAALGYWVGSFIDRHFA